MWIQFIELVRYFNSGTICWYSWINSLLHRPLSLSSIPHPSQALVFNHKTYYHIPSYYHQREKNMDLIKCIFGRLDCIHLKIGCMFNEVISCYKAKSAKFRLRNSFLNPIAVDPFSWASRFSFLMVRWIDMLF